MQHFLLYIERKYYTKIFTNYNIPGNVIILNYA